MTSRCCARRLPLASSMPQKTLGSLPCPIVYSVQIAWLPHGSNFNRAHGRGVAPLGHSAAGHLSWVETGTNQIGWVSTNFSPSLQPQPNGAPDPSPRLASPHRARGLACDHSRPVPADGPRLAVPSPCGCGSWPACAGQSAQAGGSALRGRSAPDAQRQDPAPRHPRPLPRPAARRPHQSGEPRGRGGDRTGTVTMLSGCWYLRA